MSEIYARSTVSSYFDGAGKFNGRVFEHRDDIKSKNDKKVIEF